MSTVTIELTFEQLINAFLKLSSEDQLRALNLLLQRNGVKRELTIEATQLVDEIRVERERKWRAAAEALRDDYEQDSELTAFTALDSEDRNG